MARVFMCYSRADADFCDRLTTNLRALGVPVWRDVDDIPQGVQASTTGWRAAIEEALETCTHMVVILSPASVSSDEVTAEWNRFANENKPVYPVKCSETRIPARLDILFWWDLSEYDEDKVTRLASAITSATSVESASAKEPTGADEDGGGRAARRPGARDESAGVLSRRRGRPPASDVRRSSATILAFGGILVAICALLLATYLIARLIDNRPAAPIAIQSVGIVGPGTCVLRIEGRSDLDQSRSCAGDPSCGPIVLLSSAASGGEAVYYPWSASGQELATRRGTWTVSIDPLESPSSAPEAAPDWCRDSGVEPFDPLRPFGVQVGLVTVGWRNKFADCMSAHLGYRLSSGAMAGLYYLSDAVAVACPEPPTPTPAQISAANPRQRSPR